MKKYKNINLTKNLNEAKFVTHSGKFHVDDVMATVFLSKINDEVLLARIPSTNGFNLSGKFVYDIGYRRI